MKKYDPTDRESLSRGATFNHDLSYANENELILYEAIKTLNPAFHDLVERLMAMKVNGKYLDRNKARFTVIYVLAGLAGQDLMALEDDEIIYQIKKLTNDFMSSITTAAGMEIRYA